MSGRFFFSVLLILCCTACVDRIVFDIGTTPAFAIVIDGNISDQPGPYKVLVTKAFDIESKLSIKTPLSVKQMIMSDNLGNSEVLSEIVQGQYQTSSNGMRGVVGRAYKIHIELLDGRIYESVPDTLYPSGTVDKVFHAYKEEKTPEGATNYGFDVLFNSSAGELDNYHFLWKFTGTYKVDSNPELYTVPCGESKCPAPLPCSAFILNGEGSLERVKPCECCECWTSVFNNEVIVSDDQFVAAGTFTNVRAAYVPINQWTFKYKVYTEIKQMSLSPQAFAFWKAIRSQKNATTSLFQPLSGKIPNNFKQISGPQGPIEGIFYATSIHSQGAYINRSDVPNENVIPVSPLTFNDNCTKLFPNTTTEMPVFWTE